MSFSLANTTGWVTGDLLTESQINQLDQEHAAAIDGANGGIYNLLGEIELNDRDVTIEHLITPNVTGTTVFHDNISVEGDTTIGTATSDTLTINANAFCVGNLSVAGQTVLGDSSSDALVVNADTIFYNDVQIGGDSSDTLTVNSTSSFLNDVTVGSTSADTLTINSTISAPNNVTIGTTNSNSLTINSTLSAVNDVNIGGSSTDILLVRSTSTFQNDLTIGTSNTDTLTVNSLADFLDGVYVDGVFHANGAVQLGDSTSDQIDVRGVVKYTGSGRILETGIVSNDADQDIDITLYRNVILPTTLSAPHTYNIIGTVQDGDWFFIQNLDNATHVLTGLVSGNVLSNTGYKFMRISGTWYKVVFSS